MIDVEVLLCYMSGFRIAGAFAPMSCRKAADMQKGCIETSRFRRGSFYERDVVV